MRTMAATLASFGEEQAARFRGLVLMQVLRGSRQLTDSGLVHLFLLPPKQGDPRFAIYETTQPTGFDLTLAETIQLATKAVRRADGDPRIVDGVDPRWRGVDPDRQALYLGTGARFVSSDPELTSTTIARLTAIPDRYGHTNT